MEVDSATTSLQSSLPGGGSFVSAASSIADELADRERRKNNGEKTTLLFTILLKILIGKLKKRSALICAKLFFLKSFQSIKLSVWGNVVKTMIVIDLYWLFFRMNPIKRSLLQILQSYANMTLTRVCTCPLIGLNLND